MGGDELDCFSDGPIDFSADDAVFFGEEEGDFEVGSVFDLGWAEFVADAFDADVEDGDVGFGATDDAGEDGHGHFEFGDEAVVNPVHGGVCAALQFVDAVHDARRGVGGRGATADDGDGDGGVFDEAAGVDGALHGFAGLVSAILGVDDVDEVAFVGLEAVKAEAGGVDDLFGEVQRRLAWGDAAAAHADVDFDEEADGGGGFGGGFGEVGDVSGIVDGEAEFYFLGELGESLEFSGADDLVGDEDVVDAGFCEDFGFGEFGAGHADGASGGELAFGDLGAFVVFEMRAELASAVAEEVGHALKIAIHGGGVDQQQRGFEVFNG